MKMKIDKNEGKGWVDYSLYVPVPPEGRSCVQVLIFKKYGTTDTAVYATFLNGFDKSIDSDVIMWHYLPEVLI